MLKDLKEKVDDMCEQKMYVNRHWNYIINSDRYSRKKNILEVKNVSEGLKRSTAMKISVNLKTFNIKYPHGHIEEN